MREPGGLGRRPCPDSIEAEPFGAALPLEEQGLRHDEVSTSSHAAAIAIAEAAPRSEAEGPQHDEVSTSSHAAALPLEEQGLRHDEVSTSSHAAAKVIAEAAPRSEEEGPRHDEVSTSSHAAAIAIVAKSSFASQQLVRPLPVAHWVRQGLSAPAFGRWTPHAALPCWLRTDLLMSFFIPKFAD
jgi:hypothetical protein